MAIKYIENLRVFKLDTKTSSYVFHINENLYIQNIYFGKKIDNIDVFATSDFRAGGWSTHYLDAKNNIEKEFEKFNKEIALYEVTNSMTIDKRGDQFLFRREDNSFYNEFKYLNHTVKKFRKDPTQFPSTFSIMEDGEILEIILSNNSNDIELKLRYILFEEVDTIVRNVEILNKGKELKINRAFSFNLDMPNENYSFLHFHGDWSNERNIEKVKITHGISNISTFTGRSGHEESPGIILLNEETNLDQGRAIIFNLVYSGNFCFKLNLSKFNALRIQGGINDEALELTIKENESLQLPECIITFSENGINDASIKHHDFIRKHIIRSKFVNRDRPILLNSREGFFFDFDTKKVIEYIKSSKKIGNELFVLDDGWFTNRNDDTNGLGDWDVNTSKIDLELVIKTCHEENLKFGLWIEPEMINIGTKLFDEHEEYVLKRPNTNVTLYRHQMCLDMSNDEVVDYLYKKISKYLQKYKIDYIKWDHNRHLSDIYSSKYPNITEGTLAYLVTLGTYKLFDKLTNNFPDVLFEGCASGGGRFDLGMLYYTPQIWASDETDPVQRTYIQYGTSLLFPLSTIGAHISKNPITSYFNKGAIALFGTFGFEFDPRKLNEKEILEIKELNNIFKKLHKDTVVLGDIYHLCSPFDSNYFALEALSKDKTKALVVFMNYRKETGQYRFVKLKGLKSNSIYKINNNQTLSGEHLMNIGINLTIWLEEFHTELFVIEETDYGY